MNTWKILGYLGLLPFIIPLYVGYNGTISHAWSQNVFISYSAIILSFIAGLLWRTNQLSNLSRPQIVSNALSLIAFSSLLIVEHVALILLLLSYIATCLYERSLSYVMEIDEHYLAMRLKLTLIVVSLHVIAFFLWIQ